jgi:hypothetical protein
MIDVLCRFDSAAAALAFAQEVNVVERTPDENGEPTGQWRIKERIENLDAVKIGRHARRTGGTDAAPVFSDVPGFWVLFRATHKFPKLALLKPFAVWWTGKTDVKGNEIPRPGGDVFPQHYFI